MGLIALRENDLDIPRWPLRLNPNWIHAGETTILIPGIREAGNIGNDYNSVLSPGPSAGVTVDFRVPSHHDVTNAPSNSVLNLPRINTTQDRWEVSNSSTLVANFTWAAWVRISNAGQLRSVVMGKDNAFGSGTALYLEEGASPFFRFYRGLWSDAAFTPTWNGYDVWHHVSCCNDGGNSGTDIIYINGVRGTDNVARAMGLNDDMDIGALGTNRLAKGNFAHIIEIDKVLTDNEHYALYDVSTRFDMYERVNSKKFFLVPDPAPSVGGSLLSTNDRMTNYGGFR